MATTSTNTGMDLVFITEGIDYTVEDFYNHFHTQLPLVVQVSEGVMEYMGDNKEYNFVEGEVLYLAAVSKRKRVVAQVDTGQHTRVLSLPLTLSDNLCLSRRGKCGSEQSLQDIFKHNWLPVKVRFPPSNIVIMEGMMFNTNSLPEMELMKKVDEIYFLGNYLQNGMLCKDKFRIPVYLPQLKLCRVTGMKYLKQQGWDHHCATLKEKSKQIDYNLHFESQETAVYDHTKLDSHTKYAFTEPLLYDELINIIISWPECNIGDNSADSSKKGSRSHQAVEQEPYESLSFEKATHEDYDTLLVNNSKEKVSKRIKDLTCNEVIERLKNLGLQKYVQGFYSHKIDGCLLVDLDEHILMDEFGMTKAEISRLKDGTQQGNVETTAPAVQPKTHLREQDVKENRPLVSNQKPRIFPKHCPPGSMLLASSSGFDITKSLFDKHGQQSTHAGSNTYTPMPKKVSGDAKAK